jgi:gp18
MKENLNSLIKWVDVEIQLYEEIIKDKSQSKHELTIYRNNSEKLLLTKEYLNDYEKLAKDYQKLSNKNKLLRLKIMELESQKIYEDMKKDYRANRRKWLAKI